MVVHQGLYVQEEPGNTPEPEHLLQRRERTRTFWSFFWVNRLVAAVLGRTTFLSKSQFKVPSLGSSSGTPSAAIEDSCLENLCQLWSLHDQHMERVLSFDFSALPVAEKQSVLRAAGLALNQFYGGVDARLRTTATTTTTSSSTSPPPSPSPIYFQISYHVSLILLHHPRSPPPSTPWPPRHPPSPTSSAASARQQ